LPKWNFWGLLDEAKHDAFHVRNIHHKKITLTDVTCNKLGL